MVVKSSNPGQCNLCTMSEGAKIRCVGDYNTNKSVAILIVTSYIPFQCNSLNIGEDSKIKRLLSIVRAKFPDKSVGATSIIKCVNEHSKPKTEHYKTCADNHLYSIFRRMRPQVIIAVGSKASGMFTSEKGLDNGDIVSTKYGKLVYITDISEMDKDYNYEDKFEDAIQWCFKDKVVFDTKNFKIDMPNSIKDLDLMEKEILKHNEVYVDIEASTLPFRKVSCGDKIMCASFTVKDDHAFVIPLRSCVSHYGNSPLLHARAEEVVRKIISSNLTKIGHNLKYDSTMFYKVYGMIMKNFKIDTMLMHYLFDERPPHGLKDLCNLHIPKLNNYDKVLDEYIAKHPECDPKKGGSYYYIPNGILFPYNGLDTIACKEIFKFFYKKVYDNKDWAWLMENVMIPVTKVYIGMEFNGIQTDNKALTSFGAELTQTIIKHRQDLANYLVSKGLSANLNMNAPEQIAETLLQLGEVQPEELKKNKAERYTCDDKVITALLNKGSQFAYHVNGLKKTIKKKNTYVDNYLRKCDELYRLHASYAIHFADTGRSCCSDPNLQNVPPSLRKFLIPKPGNILIERDFSQLELRLMACRTNDPVMLEIYKRNEDIHKMTAASSELIVNDKDALMNVIDSGDIGATIKFIMDYYNGLDKKYAKKIRQKAKAPNFHFIYGGYYKTLTKRINIDIDKMIKEIQLALRVANEEQKKDLKDQIKHLNESKITEEESKYFEDAFFTLYREIKTYHTDIDDYVKQYGQVTSYFGRVKHLPDAMLPDCHENRMRITEACNSAKNFPIQSAGADLKYLSLIRLQKELDRRGMETCIVNEVHDSIVSEVPINEIFEYFKLSADCMDNWDKQFSWMKCKIPTDAKVCINNWGQGIEVANEHELEILLKANKLI